MAELRRKKTALVINASVWLKDEERFTLLENLQHTPRPGEEFEINGDRWQVVESTDRIECERVVN